MRSSYGSRPRVYIGNLSNRVSDKEVEGQFSKYGRVLKIDLKNGYGFAEYDDERDASSAVRGLDGLELDGMRIRVEHAKGPRKETRERSRTNNITRAPENRIRVENLHHSVTWQILKDHMRKAGDVMFADVDKDSRGKAYGIVEFRTYDDMKRAIKRLDDTDVNGSKIYLKEDGGRRSRSRSRSNDRYKPYSRSDSGRSDSRRRSRSPRDRERSPPRRERSPPRRNRSRSPPPRRRSRSASPANRRRDLSRSPPPKDRSASPRKAASPDNEDRKSQERE
ncbi:SRSF6 [Acrasis kona]|uniref:SRSF6 n=1 Tax=Acrasis kona TaxID=1008807 RepID=A0AAW2ZC46_9EUKA